MPAQSRRSPSRPSRAQRRAGAPTSRTYNVPAARPPLAAPRRVYSVEPAPIDHTVEYRFIRKDLIRILIWSGLLITIMVVLSFVF